MTLPSKPVEKSNGLGFLAWLDRSAETKFWLVLWLNANWRRLYSPAFAKLHGRHFATSFNTMNDAMSRWPVLKDMPNDAVERLKLQNHLSGATPSGIPRRKGRGFGSQKQEQQVSATMRAVSRQLRTSGEQLAMLDATARQCGLQLTRKRLLLELKLHLRQAARRRHNGERVGPFELQAVLASPWLNTGAIDQLNAEQLGFPALRRHYRNPPELHLAFKSIVEEFSASEIATEWRPTCPTQLPQRALSKAIQWLCERESHPARLTRFILRVMQECLSVPNGTCLRKNLNHRRRQQILKSHLRSRHIPERTAAMSALFGAIVEHDDLRVDLAKLLKAGEKRLASALTALFKHIRREAQITRQDLMAHIIVPQHARLRLRALRVKLPTAVQEQIAKHPPSNKIRREREPQGDGKDSFSIQVYRIRRRYNLP